MSSTKNTLIGIVAGSLVGSALGILFAPDKGSETRSKIRKKANDTSNEISNKANELTEEITSRFRSKKAEFEKELDGLVADMHIKADDAIVSLEKKLETLRKRNAKINAN